MHIYLYIYIESCTCITYDDAMLTNLDLQSALSQRQKLIFILRRRKAQEKKNGSGALVNTDWVMLFSLFFTKDGMACMM